MTLKKSKGAGRFFTKEAAVADDLFRRLCVGTVFSGNSNRLLPLSWHSQLGDEWHSGQPSSLIAVYLNRILKASKNVAPCWKEKNILYILIVKPLFD